MIANTSILRRLPLNLERRQMIFLDGIRHAAEIADLAYRRLAHTLTQLALSPEEGEDAGGTELLTAAFLDAWAFVDAIDRMRSLVRLAPNLTLNPSKGGAGFSAYADVVRSLRNVADHLATRVEYILANDSTALGVLRWVTESDKDRRELISCTAVPGTTRNATRKLINPAGKTINRPTGQIHLEAGEYIVCLCDVYEASARMLTKLETSIEASFREQGALAGPSSGDIVVRVVLRFDEISDDIAPELAV